MAAQLLSKNSSLNHLIPLKPLFPLHYFYIFLEWSDEKREEREGGGDCISRKCVSLWIEEWYHDLTLPDNNNRFCSTNPDQFINRSDTSSRQLRQQDHTLDNK